MACQMFILMAPPVFPHPFFHGSMRGSPGPEFWPLADVVFDPRNSPRQDALVTRSLLLLQTNISMNHEHGLNRISHKVEIENFLLTKT